jgi:DNA-binding MarR family transcriptional regulator
MTKTDQPALSPLVFAVMSTLTLRDHATLAELAEHLKESPSAVGAAMQTLIDGDLATATTSHDATAPAYRVTEKGQTAFFDQVSWLKQKLTDKE